MFDLRMPDEVIREFLRRLIPGIDNLDTRAEFFDFAPDVRVVRTAENNHFEIGTKTIKTLP